MTMHLEWVSAEYAKPAIISPAELAEMSDDGNDEGHTGLYIGDSDGAILYGETNQLGSFLHRALKELGFGVVVWSEQDITSEAEETGVKITEQKALETFINNRSTIEDASTEGGWRIINNIDFEEE